MQTPTKLTQQTLERKIAFIGAGNMSQAIVGGLIKHGWQPQNIMLSNPSKAKLNALQEQYGVQITQNNIESSSFADIIILAVKPQKLKEVCSQIASLDLSQSLVISVAAGYLTKNLTTNLIQNHTSQTFNQSPAIIRAMPNTPGLIGCGATGLYATEQVSLEQKQLTETIFNSIGKTSWIEKEEHMNLVTAIAGSAPAYFFLMMQAMQEQAITTGLNAEQAQDLITQTALGAAKLAQQENTLSLEELRKQVTSPGGTTAAAIDSLYNNDFNTIVKQAVRAATQRGQELSNND